MNTPIKDWSIKTKLLAALALVVTVALIYSVTVSYYLEQFINTGQSIINSRQLDGAISRLVQIDSSFTAVVQLYTFSQDSAVLPYYDQRMAQYQETLSTLRGLTLRADEQSRLNKLLATRNELFSLDASIMALDKQKDFDQGKRILQGQQYTDLKNKLTSLADDETKSIQTSLARYEDQRSILVDQVHSVTYGVLLLFVLGGCFLAYIVSATMVRTSREMEEAASAIGRGEIGRRVPVRSKDEIGRAAVAFNKLAVALDEKQGAGILEQITRDIGE